MCVFSYDLFQIEPDKPSHFNTAIEADFNTA